MFDFRSLSKETKAKIIKRYRDNNRSIPEAIRTQLEDGENYPENHFSKESMEKVNEYYSKQNQPFPEIFKEQFEKQESKNKTSKIRFF